MIVGLTGLSCAGKNYIASGLEERGYIVIDVDALGHIALEAARDEIVRHWGEEILSHDGSIDRAALALRVFNSRNELTALEELIHPIVNREIERRVDSSDTKCYIINAALIHKTSIFHKIDKMIIVYAPFFLRIFRAIKRDGLSLQEVLRRFYRQKTFMLHYLKKKTDIYSVYNAGFGSSVRRLDALERFIKIGDAVETI